jgi:hypothetical protein
LGAKKSDFRFDLWCLKFLTPGPVDTQLKVRKTIDKESIVVNGINYVSILLEGCQKLETVS